MFEVINLNAGYEFRDKFVHAVRNVSFKVEKNDFSELQVSLDVESQLSCWLL